MSRSDIGHPIPHRLVDGLLKGSLAGCYRDDCCPQEFHPGNVETLTLRIGCPHVNDTFAAESCRYCGGCHPMLPGTGLRDDSLFPHAAGEQNLPKCVVYLVRASVQQILPLEINSGATELV